MAHSRTPSVVVVIDDYPDTVGTMAALLQRAGGCVVHTAGGGSAGLDLIRAVRPDAVILDLDMPDVDGRDVARAVRADPAVARAVLIALTGHGRSQDREATAAAGFDAHFVKGDHPMLVIDAVARLVAARRAAPPADRPPDESRP